MCVSYFLKQCDLEKVDTVALYQTLKSIGYKVSIGNGLKVEAVLGKYESKEHVYQEMLIDIESLLKRFRIKK
jgi:hypothetical protein